MTVHGPLDRRRLATVVADSDICVAPLRRDLRNREQGCSPIKIFEYMSAARPVLSTDLPCIREIIRPDVTGVAVSSARPSVLAQHLLQLAEDAALRRRLGARARDEILKHATWQHRREALVEQYQRLLARP